MNYALLFNNLSFYNELYTVRLGAILEPFWHREGSMAEPSRAELSRAGTVRAEPSRAEPSRAEPSRPGRAGPSRTGPRQPQTAPEPPPDVPGRAETAPDGPENRIFRGPDVVMNPPAHPSARPPAHPHRAIRGFVTPPGKVDFPFYQITGGFDILPIYVT